jgi:hypothetical protein
MTTSSAQLGAALAAAVLCMLVLAGTGGATHAGSLQLAHPNTAADQTSLTASIANPVLRVVNQGTAGALRADGQSGAGVTSTSVTGPGLQAQSQGGIGVVGTHANNTGTNPGLQGQTNSTDPNAAGVVGRDLAGPGKGVYGKAVGAGSAIFGDNADPAGWAGNFNGNVNVTGNVNASNANVTGNAYFGAKTRQMLNLYEENYAIGVQDWTVYNRSRAWYAWYQGGSHSNAILDPGPGGTMLMRLGSDGLWLPGSNENLEVGGVIASAGGIQTTKRGNGAAVLGVQSTNSGGNEGVVGITSDRNGVRGEDTAGDGNGVYGKSVSNNTLFAAVRGENTGSGNGVLGTSANGIGVFGESRNGYAGVFNGKTRVNGDFHVEGNLTKRSGSFRIDHPLDPKNKYLQHSFVESPDMMNVYNGNVTTDRRGFAVVRLPGYFEALNRDFRYQLTVLGRSFAQAIVWNEIGGNRFTIKTSRPDVRVSWQVTGIRKDAWANAHRIKVVVEKTAAERSGGS